MSEAIQTEQSPYPGEAWTEIVRRPTLEEFSRAYPRTSSWHCVHGFAGVQDKIEHDLL